MFLYLVEVAGVTKQGAAGILGNMFYESGVNPRRVQMGYGWTDDAYTSAVDSGSYRNFVRDSIGYGLVQFTSSGLKQGVYNKAKQTNKSVGDLEVQLSCVSEALQSSYVGLYNTLKTSTDVRECCVAFLLQYERPYDQGIAVQNKRSDKAQEYFNRFQNLSASSGMGTFSISYDRKKDPLLLEFGYALQVPNESHATIGKQMTVTPNKTQYPISAINTADLLNDIFDVFGISTQSSSSGERVPGQAVMKSGKVVTSGTKLVMPSGQAQTGIIANYTAYDRSWAAGTTQRTVYDMWVSGGKKSNRTIATVNGYYLIAPGRYFSKSAGDVLEVCLEDNTKFMCMVADTKGADAPNEYGHLFGNAVDVIEWESTCSSQSQLSEGLRSWGILNKKVSYMINYGTYFQ